MRRRLAPTVALALLASSLLLVPAADAAFSGGSAPSAAAAATGASSGGVSFAPDAESGGATPAEARQAGGIRFQSVTPKRTTAKRVLPGSRRAKPLRRTRRDTKAPKAKPRKTAPAKQPAKTTPAKRTPAKPSPAAGAPSGRFPVAGPHTYGSGEARFGAGRDGHVHQGQDVLAASGTPVVAPLAGTITVRANQPGGAGNYLVLRGTDGRSYVFMHLLDGADRVAEGTTVRAGQQLSEVGSTGASSGPHLHFEIWPGEWYGAGVTPIDPLPTLLSWDR